MTEQAAHELGAHDWAGEMGERWNAYLDTFESMIGPVGEAILRCAEIEPGEHVLDIGPGGGVTSFEIAERVGPSGRVLGLDLSPVLVETARRRAAELGLGNVEFRLGDAGTIALEERFDCLFSRFGVMFFEDPYAAFAHMRSFGRPGARLRFGCWGPPPANPWAAELMEVPRKYVEIPESDPRAPGPFAFADPDYVVDILTRSGFGEIELTEWTGEQLVGGAGATPEEAAQFLLDALFVGEALKDESEATKARAYEDLLPLLARYRTERGISMQASAWLVAARC